MSIIVTNQDNMSGVDFLAVFIAGKSLGFNGLRAIGPGEMPGMSNISKYLFICDLW